MHLLSSGDCGIPSNFCAAVSFQLGNHCQTVLLKVIGAVRQPILQELLGTQSCIVREGFGAGLGQSDRDGEEEGRVMFVRGGIYLFVRKSSDAKNYI